MFFKRRFVNRRSKTMVVSRATLRHTQVPLLRDSFCFAPSATFAVKFIESNPTVHEF